MFFLWITIIFRFLWYTVSVLSVNKEQYNFWRQISSSALPRSICLTSCLSSATCQGLKMGSRKTSVWKISFGSWSLALTPFSWVETGFYMCRERKEGEMEINNFWEMDPEPPGSLVVITEAWAAGANRIWDCTLEVFVRFRHYYYFMLWSIPSHTGHQRVQLLNILI